MRTSKVPAPAEGIEFGNALSAAVTAGNSSALIAFLDSGSPEQRMLAAYIAELTKPKPTRGRPVGKDQSRAAVAQRNAAHLVALMKVVWLKASKGKKRVPELVTEGFIRNAIPLAAKTFDVPEEDLDFERVLALLGKISPPKLL